MAIVCDEKQATKLRDRNNFMRLMLSAFVWCPLFIYRAHMQCEKKLLFVQPNSISKSNLFCCKHEIVIWCVFVYHSLRVSVCAISRAHAFTSMSLQNALLVFCFFFSLGCCEYACRSAADLVFFLLTAIRRVDYRLIRSSFSSIFGHTANIAYTQTNIYE